MTNKTYTKIIETIKTQYAHGAWAQGVKEYALELVENLDMIEDEDLNAPALVKDALLNGADNWTQYSYGGCALIYNADIAQRLCNNTELKRTRNGERRPNKAEEWLDTQARALHQAAQKVTEAIQAVTA